MSGYELVGGVQWCSAHSGIVDEAGEHPQGPCDLADTDNEPCVIHELWVNPESSRIMDADQ